MSFPPETFLNSGVSLTFLTPVWPTNRRTTSRHLEYLPVRLSDWPSSHRTVWVDRFKIAEEAPATLGSTLSSVSLFHGTSLGDTDTFICVIFFYSVSDLVLISPPYLGPQLFIFFLYIYHTIILYIFLPFFLLLFIHFSCIIDCVICDRSRSGRETQWLRFRGANFSIIGEWKVSDLMSRTNFFPRGLLLFVCGSGFRCHSYVLWWWL